MPAALHMLLSEEKSTYYILLILENQAGAVGRGWGTKRAAIPPTPLQDLY
jgi:hypothetical protein